MPILDKEYKNIDDYINSVFKFGKSYTIYELLNEYKNIDYIVSKSELLDKPVHVIILKLELEDNTIKYFLYQITDFDSDDIESIKYHEIINNFNLNQIKKDLKKISTLGNTLF